MSSLHFLFCMLIFVNWNFQIPEYSFSLIFDHVTNFSFSFVVFFSIDYKCFFTLWRVDIDFLYSLRYTLPTDCPKRRFKKKTERNKTLVGHSLCVWRKAQPTNQPEPFGSDLCIGSERRTKKQSTKCPSLPFPWSFFWYGNFQLLLKDDQSGKR